MERPCGWPKPGSSAGHRPAPDWARGRAAPDRSRPAPISAQDRRASAAETPARIPPPLTIRCVRAREPQPFCQLQHHLARRRGAAGLHERKVTRGDFGVAGEIKLAEMAALPPFAQVIADMDRLGLFGACRRSMSVHGGKPIMRKSLLPLP